MNECMKDGEYLCDTCRYSEAESGRCYHPSIYKDPQEDSRYEEKLPTTADTQN